MLASVALLIFSPSLPHALFSLLPLQVFPSPEKALALYIQRIFEQRVGVALAAALKPPPPGAGHSAQGAYLSLLAEAFKKTKQLAADLQARTGSLVWAQ